MTLVGRTLRNFMLAYRNFMLAYRNFMLAQGNFMILLLMISNTYVIFQKLLIQCDVQFTGCYLLIKQTLNTTRPSGQRQF